MNRLFSDYRPGENGLHKVMGTLESDIMEVIWRKDCEVTVREVYEELLANRTIAYTTVMTIMGRLAEKRLLTRRKDGNTWFFLPAISRTDFSNNVVENVLDSLLEEFSDSAVAHFMARIKRGDKDALNKVGDLLKEIKDPDEDYE